MWRIIAGGTAQLSVLHAAWRRGLTLVALFKFEGDLIRFNGDNIVRRMVQKLGHFGKTQVKSYQTQHQEL